jgi:prepilin-type N-terminal cleavage/methylation domain-containing protein
VTVDLAHPRRRAFTLIEATVTMIIIAIISAIAITSYTWTISSATQSDAEQTLNAIALESAAYYSQHTAWPTEAQMLNVESSYAYVASTTASTTDEQVSVGTNATSNELDLAAFDAGTNTCFFITVAPPGTSTPTLKVSSTSLPCTALTIVSSSLTESSGPPWS